MRGRGWWLIPIAAFAASAPNVAFGQRNVDLRSARPDLADAVAGTYFGDVISDARGSSRSDVTITVSKVGPNLVEIRSDYARIPTVRIPLIVAMNSILSNDADYVFLINREQDPRRLDLTIDDASLSLQKR